MNLKILLGVVLGGCLLTGCFDWTIPAGARLTCAVDAPEQYNGTAVGCPEGWTCDGTQCVSMSCGNGERDPGEECDDATANNDELTGASVCRTNCRRPYCGDGVIDEGEACDDGADGDRLDGCSDFCIRVGRCGDGIVQAAVETCDDGNLVSGDLCSSDCISEEGFSVVRTGTVVMGDESVEDLSPTLQFELEHEFVMMDHEVTQQEWREVMMDFAGEKGFRGDGPAFGDCPQCPIENVSWFDALAYCNTRSRKEGLKPCYGIEPAEELFAEARITFSGVQCTGYRLPLEAEWEYAVRGGPIQERTRFYGGADEDDVQHMTASGPDPNCRTNPVLQNIAWHCANSWADPLDMWETTASHIHIGKQQEANALGLHDMLGNVWEWVWDNWQPYADRATIGDDWTLEGPAEGEDRVKRGGGYFNSAAECTMAVRQPHSPNSRNSSIGFRVVRTLPTSESSNK